MRFEDSFYSKDNRFWLGRDAKSDRYYASIPVANTKVDYIEYYYITDQQYAEFSDDEALALQFVEECRRHEHDDLLVHKPGTDRGIPV
jgi:hypothetical protein